MSTFDATYSPDDDKLRLYASTRLDSETYARVKAAGFGWAPRQELFFAVWSPGREDLLVELAGEIGDDDSSLVVRAEERADRFDGYAERRGAEAKAAFKAVDGIAERFHGGQPILVGHHSEKSARKDQERIHNGMRRAINLGETSGYWAARAAGAIAAAKYKERPDVRERRIKTIESDRRKRDKDRTECLALVAAWEKIHAMGNEPAKQHATALTLTGSTRAGHIHVAEDGRWSAWDVLLPDDRRYQACPAWTVDQVYECVIPIYRRMIANAERWLTHFDNRLSYERAMLGEQGGAAAERFAFEVGGWALVGTQWRAVTKVNLGAEGRAVSISIGRRLAVPVERVTQYRAPAEGDVERVKAATAVPPMVNYEGEGFAHITQAAWTKISKDYRGGLVVEPTETVGRHRVRHALGAFLGQRGDNERHRWFNVFLTDAKVVQAPAPEGKAVVTLPSAIADTAAVQADIARRTEAAQRRADAQPESAPLNRLRETLKAGVQVVVADQLFPTPPDIAALMMDVAEIESGHRVLEPSAGTGNLIHAAIKGGRVCDVVAVELNGQLASALRERFPMGRALVHAGDFLECTADMGKFDRIVMNPPFKDGADIRHIAHALQFLADGGRLVAICANGPRQQAKLKPLAATWEELPDDTFAEQGTGVRTVLLTIEGVPARRGCEVPSPDADKPKQISLF